MQQKTAVPREILCDDHNSESEKGGTPAVTKFLYSKKLAEGGRGELGRGRGWRKRISKKKLREIVHREATYL